MNNDLVNCTFEINRELRGWHYGWTASKHRQDIDHVFIIHVFNLNQGKYDSVGILYSPSFQIRCSRRVTTLIESRNTPKAFKKMLPKPYNPNEKYNQFVSHSKDNNDNQECLYDGLNRDIRDEPSTRYSIPIQPLTSMNITEISLPPPLLPSLPNSILNKKITKRKIGKDTSLLAYASQNNHKKKMKVLKSPPLIPYTSLSQNSSPLRSDQELILDIKSEPPSPITLPPSPIVINNNEKLQIPDFNNNNNKLRSPPKLILSPPPNNNNKSSLFINTNEITLPTPPTPPPILHSLHSPPPLSLLPSRSISPTIEPSMIYDGPVLSDEFADSHSFVPLPPPALSPMLKSSSSLSSLTSSTSDDSLQENERGDSSLFFNNSLNNDNYLDWNAFSLTSEYEESRFIFSPPSHPQNPPTTIDYFDSQFLQSPPPPPAKLTQPKPEGYKMTFNYFIFIFISTLFITVIAILFKHLLNYCDYKTVILEKDICLYLLLLMIIIASIKIEKSLK